MLVSGPFLGAQLWRPSPQDTRQEPTWQLCTLLWYRCVITDAEWHAIAKQDCDSMLLYVVIGYQHDLLHVRESVDMLCFSMVRLKAQCWS